MRLRNFIVAYVLVMAFLLLAVRRPAPRLQNHYSQVVDLTDPAPAKTNSEARSGTRIIFPIRAASWNLGYGADSSRAVDRTAGGDGLESVVGTDFCR
jgi:hypothetical protein